MPEPEKLTTEELITLLEGGQEAEVFRLLDLGIISWEQARAAIKEWGEFDSLSRAALYLEDRGYPEPEAVKAPTQAELNRQKANILASLGGGDISNLEAEAQLAEVYSKQGYEGQALIQKVAQTLSGAFVEERTASLPQRLAAIQDEYAATASNPEAYATAVLRLQNELKQLPGSDLVKDLAKQAGIKDLEDYENLARALLPQPQPGTAPGLIYGQTPFTKGYKPPVTPPPFAPAPEPLVNLPPEGFARFMAGQRQGTPDLPEGYMWQPTGPDYARIFTDQGKGPVKLEGWPEVWKLTEEPAAPPGPEPFVAPPFTAEQEAEKQRLWEMSGQTIPFEDWMKQPFNLPEYSPRGVPNPVLPPPGYPGGPTPATSPIPSGGVSPLSGFTGRGLESAFFSAVPEGMPRRKQQIYRSFFNDALDDFLTTMGRQIRAGEESALEPASFFSNYPFEQKYAALTPSEKGLGVSQYNPFGGKWRL